MSITTTCGMCGAVILHGGVENPIYCETCGAFIRWQWLVFHKEYVE